MIRILRNINFQDVGTLIDNITEHCVSDEQDNARGQDTLTDNKTCQLGERKINTSLETLNNLGITNAKELVRVTFGLGETEYWKIVDKNNINIDPETNVENKPYFKVVPKSNSMQFSANRGLPSDIEHITSM
ncbi:uncharacterized protein [Antedon mediterranea]|uniref:uncharacterized protein n=1 Tax=Antedon mediterranea TaxID=105859 RepID=UPI003AF43EB8